MSRLHLLVVSACLLSVTTVAEAKRSQREGFNFGLGVRAMGSTDNNKGAGEDSDSKSESSSQAFTPHIGYVFFETLDLGLTSYFENEQVKQTFKSKDGSQEIDRTSNHSIKSGSLYLRFLFAQFMYFEGGFGLYQRKSNISDEYVTRNEDGSFTGEREDSSKRGLGPGYHAGAGVEVPVAQGFFISSSFLMRTIQLRDYGGNGDVGKKRTRLEKRELSFGLSHYID